MTTDAIALDAINTRLDNIEADLRWLAQQDRHGDLLCLEVPCRDMQDGYARRQATRVALQQEHARLTVAYVHIVVPMATGGEDDCDGLTLDVLAKALGVRGRAA